MKTRAENHTFPKKAVFTLIKLGFYPINHPFLVKVIFMINRKGLLRDWNTLMTDNNLDFNDLNDLIPLNNQTPLSTENHITQAKMTRKAGLCFCRERRKKCP